MTKDVMGMRENEELRDKCGKKEREGEGHNDAGEVYELFMRGCGFSPCEGRSPREVSCAQRTSQDSCQSSL